MKKYSIVTSFLAGILISWLNGPSRGIATKANADKSSHSTERLIAVVALIRHGRRAPYKPFLYPNYTFKRSQWPNGHGQLLDSGILQQFSNGQVFRQRYDALCQRSIRFEKEIMVLSSKTKRTLISSIAFLEGLMQRSGNMSEDTLEEIKNIRYRDVKKHTKTFIPNIFNIKMVPNIYLRNNHVCPNVRQRKYKNFLVDNRDVRNFEPTHTPLVWYIRNQTGIEEKDWNYSKMVFIGDALECTESAGYELPAWTRTKVSEIPGMETVFSQSPKTVKNVIETCATKFFVESMKGNDTLQKLAIGLLAHEILKRFRDEGRKFKNYMKVKKENYLDRSYNKSVIHESEKRISFRSRNGLRELERQHWINFPKHFYIYMAHDITLSALMTLFNVNFDRRPACSSSFIMELVQVWNHTQKSSSLKIRFLYKPDEGKLIRANVREAGTVDELKESLRNKLTNNVAYVREMCKENFIFQKFN